MVLVDYQIRGLLADGAVENGQPELVNPASLDVRLGHTIFVENPQAERFNSSDRWLELSIAHHTVDSPFWMRPGQFLLAHTIEIFHLPRTSTAQFKLTSTRGREGYQHALAGWCDPG